MSTCPRFKAGYSSGDVIKCPPEASIAQPLEPGRFKSSDIPLGPGRFISDIHVPLSLGCKFYSTLTFRRALGFGILSHCKILICDMFLISSIFFGFEAAQSTSNSFFVNLSAKKCTFCVSSDFNLKCEKHFPDDLS